MENGEGNGNPLQYSCLENPLGGGAWWAAVHGVAKLSAGTLELARLFQQDSKNRLVINKPAYLCLKRQLDRLPSSSVSSDSSSSQQTFTSACLREEVG